MFNLAKTGKVNGSNSHSQNSYFSLTLSVLFISFYHNNNSEWKVQLNPFKDEETRVQK